MNLNDDWVKDIQKKLEQGDQAQRDKPWKKHSIYKVPTWMNDKHPPNTNKFISGYIPEIISLGPYHRGLSHIQPMEPHKWRVLSHMLNRKSQVIAVYLTAVKKLEQQARDCYESPVELTSNQFVEMMVLDGCFVLEYLRGRAFGYTNLKYDGNDPIFSKDSICHVIAMDLMKLENQIPLIVLQKLLEVQYKRVVNIEVVPNLVMLVLTLEWVTINSPLTRVELELMRDVVSKDQVSEPMVHCLDIFRRALMYKPESSSPKTLFGLRVIWDKLKTMKFVKSRKDVSEHFMAYCISDLRKAGVKFRPRRKLPFWDIQFKEGKGVLKIHPFKIDSATETIFRNLTAYEQCHVNIPRDMVITNYVTFMDNLIDTASDIAYLREAGIIVHYLGSDGEVADLFNRLGKTVYVDKKKGGLYDVYRKLNRYCGRKGHKHRATLQNEYLSNPWVITSIIAAFFLFLFTGVQTVYTVYAYYNPRK